MALENGASQFALVERSHIAKWVAGSVPQGPGPEILCEALGRRLGRVVTPGQLGFGPRDVAPDADGLWAGDTLSALSDLWSRDVTIDRRQVLGATAYQVAALAVPGQSWWAAMAARGKGRGRVQAAQVGRGDLEVVRDAVAMFSTMDQRRGGGHGRTAVVQYLNHEVAQYLQGRFATEELRKEMFSAAGELSYLSGWMAFDAGSQAVAQRYFTLAVKLAAEADNAPLAGHVLRAAAHQANDLKHYQLALTLADASVDGERYRTASHRERALLGVVHARALSSNSDKVGAAKALLRAEDDLARAGTGDDEPARVWFFQEASLAHETACALRDVGDLDGAVREFHRSVRTRKTAAFARTHAVTLGYLGDVQARQGNIEQACATWSDALDRMDGIRSGRTVQTAVQMRCALSPFRQRGVSAVHDIDARASAYLARAA
ncbi:Tat pathway signal protein [Streptacidiphilus sp. EB103A]|uniref:Tat pathway signal protein n=1 Tax=Streptacidiphilus sp. EB103A TaxID=3156275 RepID=UPI003511DEB7